MYHFRTATALSLTALLAACGSDNGSNPTVAAEPNLNLPQLSAASSGTLVNCADLTTRFTFANNTVASAEVVTAGALKLAGKDIPEHCLVKGSMYKRTGSDGKDYAIGYEMRMPKAWNGRFYYQGNGGLDGSVVTAMGNTGGGPVTGALLQGFAVISSDAGHTGAQTTAFGFEAQSRLDYGYQAVGKLTPMAKELIKSAYGRAADRSYIGGCSNGGRHTMVAMARYGDQYDGFLAGAPGYNLPKAAIANLWGAQQYNKLATAGATVVANGSPIPDLSTAFTNAERSYVAGRILAVCDGLDDATDGIVSDVAACQAKFNFDSDVATCTSTRDGKCLTAAQKAVVKGQYAGFTTSAGAMLYNKFWWDAGIAGAGWGTWKFVNSLALDPLAVGTVFRVPPAFIANPATDPLEPMVAQMSATNTTYTESGMSLMTPPNPADLKTLRDRGAKVMVYHGASDPIFSAADTATWYDALNGNNQNVAKQFARFFVVPSMGHCSGGPAVDQFDMLSSLVNWVEKGQAPDSVVATGRGAGNAGGANVEYPAEWNAARTRLLCPYPLVARYATGNIENASSFVCMK
ncbi:MAG: hypothetical protein RLZZ502_739 [Pseudomonadota bacterium]|jgi:feruloyl esterase